MEPFAPLVDFAKWLNKPLEKKRKENKMNIYKVVEFFPQSKVRIIRVLEAESEEEATLYSNELPCLEEKVDIDYGGEAWTESVELLVKNENR